jgi:hypothetical protein
MLTLMTLLCLLQQSTAGDSLCMQAGSFLITTTTPDSILDATQGFVITAELVKAGIVKAYSVTPVCVLSTDSTIRVHRKFIAGIDCHSHLHRHALMTLSPVSAASFETGGLNRRRKMIKILKERFGAKSAWRKKLEDLETTGSLCVEVNKAYFTLSSTLGICHTDMVDAEATLHHIRDGLAAILGFDSELARDTSNVSLLSLNGSCCI